MPVLLATGFGKWGDHRQNASWEMLRDLDPELPPGWELKIARIPVSWDVVPARLRMLLDDEVKVAVLFGQGRGDAICLERGAVNFADQTAVDAEGNRFEKDVIRSGGPAGYYTGLPWRRVVSSLEKAGIPILESRHAGGFLCNFAFYHLMHLIDEVRPDLVGGFVHVPPLSGMPLSALKNAAEIILRTVVS
jgi:pyroglutamyl-peptidase